MKNSYPCPECNISFSRYFNLQRHQKTIHGEDDNDEDKDESAISSQESEKGSETHSSLESERESETSNESTATDVTQETCDKSEDDESSDEEMDQEEDDEDAFRNLIDGALNQYHYKFKELTEQYLENGLRKKDAIDEAFEALRPYYEKALKNHFTNYTADMFVKRRNPLFRSILKKIKDFQNDGLSEDEAIKSAVSYRKHSIYNLLNLKDLDVDEKEEEELDTEI